MLWQSRRWIAVLTSAALILTLLGPVAVAEEQLPSQTTTEIGAGQGATGDNTGSNESTGPGQVTSADQQGGSNEDPGFGAGSGDSTNPDTGNPDTGNPDTGNPDTGNPDTENPDTENPDTENPDTENPATENPTPGACPEGGTDECSDLPAEEVPEEESAPQGQSAAEIERDSQGRLRFANQVIVRIDPNPRLKGLAAAEEGPSIDVAAVDISSDGQYMLLDLDLPEGMTVEDAIAQLRESGIYLTVEPNYVRMIQTDPTDAPKPDDGLYDKQWGLEAVYARHAWAYLQTQSLDEDGLVVAVVDTGVDADHPDFEGVTILEGASFVGATLEGVPVPDATADDDNGHGTYVTGIIAAETNNGIGVAGTVGPYSGSKVSILPVKVLDKNGYGSSWQVAQGIRWAVEQGARVINLSFGGYGYSTAEKEAVNYALQNDVVVVAAAGNSGGSVNNFYPAAFPGVIAVGAVDESGARADFSNYGSALDIMAPGVGVVSTIPAEFVEDDCQQPTCYVDGESYYVSWKGTSASAPFVSGAAALLLLQEPGLGAEEVAERLTSTAAYLGDSSHYGAGLLQIEAALRGRTVSDEGSVRFLMPEDGETLWGDVELRVRVTEPSDYEVEQVTFYLNGSELASVAKEMKEGTGIFSWTWSTDQLPAGDYQLRAEAEFTNVSDAGDKKYAQAEITVTLTSGATTGLTLVVRDNDNEPVAGAAVALFYRADSEEPGIPYWYEPAFYGTTNDSGRVTISSDYATDGYEYTAVIWSQDAARPKIMVKHGLRAPGSYDLGGQPKEGGQVLAFQEVEVAAYTRVGRPLSGAEVWVSYEDENGVRIPYPLPGFNLDDNGTGTVWVSPGRYDFHVRAYDEGYFLTEKGVEVDEDDEYRMSIVFEPDATNTTRLTVGLHDSAYPSEGYLYLWEPYFLFAYTIPVASGEEVVVSNVDAKVVLRLWVEDPQNQQVWAYLAESVDVVSFTSGDRTLDLGQDLWADIDFVTDNVPAGDQLAAGVRFVDFVDGVDLFLRDVQYANGSLAADTHTASIAVLQPGGETERMVWSADAATWVPASSLEPRVSTSLSWKYSYPELRIYRTQPPQQDPVHTSSAYSYYHTVYWNGPLTAVEGTYMAVISLNAGPMGGSKDAEGRWNATEGVAYFIVESQRPMMQVFDPAGNPMPGAEVRILYQEGNEWVVALKDWTDSEGTLYLPKGFDVPAGSLLQVEGLYYWKGQDRRVALNRTFNSVADLRSIYASEASQVTITATFANGRGMPGAYLLAQPASPLTDTLPATAHALPLDLLTTGSDGTATVWLDPGIYHINAAFLSEGTQTTEAYWLLKSVQITGQQYTVQLDGTQTGKLRVMPGQGISRVAVALFTEKVYTGMSYLFTQEGVLYASPDTYRTYATVTRHYDNVSWNYWERTSLGTLTLTKDKTEVLAFDTDISVNLQLSLVAGQDLLPGISTLNGTVTIQDQTGNVLQMVWVDLNDALSSATRLPQSGPEVPERVPAAYSHWDTLPFLTVNRQEGDTAVEVAHYNDDLHFNKIAWPIPADVQGGAYTAQISLQVSPEGMVTSNVASFTIGQTGVIITSPQTGEVLGSRKFTVEGYAEPKATVQLWVAQGKSPADSAFSPWDSTAQADDSGHWSIEYEAPEDMVYTMYAVTQLYNHQLTSNTVVVTVASAVPQAPVLRARAWNATQVELIWEGDPGTAIRHVRVYRTDGSGQTRPIYVLPASDRRHVDSVPEGFDEFKYKVCYVNYADVESCSDTVTVKTPGLTLETSGTLWGLVDLVAKADAPERVGMVRFLLGTSSGGDATASELARLTGPGLADPFRYQWNSTKTPDGEYVLWVETYADPNADPEEEAPIAAVSQSVTIANQVTSGLRLSVRNPDETPAGGAVVAVYPKAGDGYSLDGGLTGNADAEGRLELAIPNGAYLVTVSSQMADGRAVFYRAEVEVPGTYALGDLSDQLVAEYDLAGLDATGAPLTEADLLVTTRAGEVWLPFSAVFPKATGDSSPAQTGADGRLTLLATASTAGYGICLRKLDGDTLYQLCQWGAVSDEVTLDGRSATHITGAVDVAGASPSVVTVSVRDAAGPEGDDAWTKAAEELRVTPGSYDVSVTAEFKEEGSDSVFTYTFTTLETRNIFGKRLNVMAGGGLHIALTGGRVAYLRGDSIGVTVADDYGFALTKPQPTLKLQTTETPGTVLVHSDQPPLVIPDSIEPGTYNLVVELDAGPWGSFCETFTITVEESHARTFRLLDLDAQSGASGADVWLLKKDGDAVTVLYEARRMKMGTS